MLYHLLWYRRHCTGLAVVIRPLEQMLQHEKAVLLIFSLLPFQHVLRTSHVERGQSVIVKRSVITYDRIYILGSHGIIWYFSRQ